MRVSAVVSFLCEPASRRWQTRRPAPAADAWACARPRPTRREGVVSRHGLPSGGIAPQRPTRAKPQSALRRENAFAVVGRFGRRAIKRSSARTPSRRPSSCKVSQLILFRCELPRWWVLRERSPSTASGSMMLLLLRQDDGRSQQRPRVCPERLLSTAIFSLELSHSPSRFTAADGRHLVLRPSK